MSAKQEKIDMEPQKAPFPRAYRSLLKNRPQQLVFFILFVLSVVILLLAFYPQITRILAEQGVHMLQVLYREENFGVTSSEFIPQLGSVYSVTMPSSIPSPLFSFLNLIVSSLILLFFVTGKRKGKPVSIYIVICILIHLISSLHFLFAPEYFPYSASEYLELYIKQQLSVWLCMIVIAGFATGVIGGGSLKLRIAYYLYVLLYSFIFGCVRYLVFMLIIFRFSSIYMAVLFFSLGPFFDFLYLVYIYGVFIDRMVTHLESERGQKLWQWF